MLIDIGNGVIVDAEHQLREFDRVEYEDSLYAFLKAAWRFIDPSPWKDGWPIEAVAEHLQAVIDGDIRRLLINLPPRLGKPVRHDALISTARGLIPLSEVGIGDLVLTHKGRFQPVIGVHPQGVLPTLRLTTRTGREVVAAPDHPFLTTDGWVEIGKLEAHDVVATVPQYFSSGEDTITPETARLLGYLVGDGSCQGSPNITVADDIEAADIEAVIAAAGFRASTQTYRMANTGYMLRRIAISAPADHIHRPTTGYRGPVRQFMEQHGLWRMTSYTKHIPDAVMRGSDEVVRAFVGAYWACDGHICSKGAKRDGCERDDLFVGCDSVNRGFILQMQTLLLRLGISSIARKKVAKVKTKRQGDTYTSYSLGIASQDDTWRFANTITIPHTKNGRLDRARKRRFDFDQTLRGEVVETIEPAGEAECICLTVEEDESFVANGFAVHNSSICSVALPAWTWAQPDETATSGPKVQFLHASYAEKLSLRDSVKCRRLIESPWYQGHWRDRFSLLGDQNTKSRFGNDRGGERLITSIGGAATGEGMQIGVVDDPNAANEAFSEATIEATLEWWDGTMSTRLNDQKTGAFIVIQQRLAEDDLSGHILEQDRGEWTHLMLPMRYEPDRSFKTAIGWSDPRTEPGELLWAERFGEAEVAGLERSLASRAPGQLQQRPEPAGGGVIKRDWWQLWDRDAFPPMDYIIASLDTAYTMKTENDFSALTVWGVFTTDADAIAGRVLDAEGRPVYAHRSVVEQAPKVMLMHAWQERLELHELVEKVAKTCKALKCDTVLIESKAAGISVAQELRRLYSGERFGVVLNDPGSQDKLSRLYSCQHLWAEGMIYCPDRKWADMVITQVGQFPRGKHDDLVDTCSQALRRLRDMGLLVRAPERMQALEESQVYTGRPPAPLYPA